MKKVNLRKIINNDIEHFSVWWRDMSLIRLTSGNIELISDEKVKRYFKEILDNKTNHHFMIDVDNHTIGHVSLSMRQGGWYETQIVIGNNKYLGQGYGSKAINLLLSKAKEIGLSKIYLEVRPENTRAINAYTKCGFKEVRIIKYPNNTYLPETLRMELRMEKIL